IDTLNNSHISSVGADLTQDVSRSSQQSREGKCGGTPASEWVEMSLFSNFGSGDIWSNTDFSLASPINDILDKATYTLEEILAEDEVLQEVKSNNTKLVSL
ncbi:unnamed protein product, partial [Discosporangium mesarthrocarpum]